MLTIIFSWAILFFVIFLVGRLVLRTGLLSFLNLKGNIEWYECFWVGLVAVIAILQIWSIFLPVNVFALLFIFLLSVASLFIGLTKRVPVPKLNFKFLIYAALVLLVISYFASLSSGWPDTYGYHLNAVKWSNLYKVVPGLANLHTRLGFNSSFFLFASMIDNLFLKDRSSHIALSLLTSVLSIEFLWIFLKSKNNYLKIFVLLSLPIFVEGIFHSVQVSSLSYDFALLIVILAVCIELIRGERHSFFVAAILSMMLVTVKLSGAVFAFVIIALVAYKLIMEKSKLSRTSFIFVLAGSILVIPYIVRNIILSGWPLYPLPVLGLSLPWTVPQGQVAKLLEVIKAWAILPGTHYGEAMGMSFGQWFPIWFLRNVRMVELKIFFLTLIFLIISTPLKFISKDSLKKNTGLYICSLAGIASIFYLILSAPDLRFGGIYFWVFFASVGSLLFTKLIKTHPIIGKLIIVFSVILTVIVSWPPRLDGEIMLKSVRWDQSSAKDQKLITPKDGNPAFKIYVPKSDGDCGNSELPCTPEINNNFKEIVPGDISKGFAPVQ